MTEVRDGAENQAGERELAKGDASPAPVRPAQEVDPKQEGVSNSHKDETVAHESWEQRHKTWRGFTSIVSSARRPDEEPPFSDD